MKFSLYPLAFGKDHRDGTVNGSNNLLRFWVARDARYARAVCAEELFEHRHKRKWFAIPYFWAIFTDRVNYLERMEVMGRAVKIEWIVKHTASQSKYNLLRRSQASALVAANGSYRKKGLFENASREEVTGRITLAAVDAAEWVAKNAAVVSRVSDKIDLPK